jgi:hypothetical protein
MGQQGSSAGLKAPVPPYAVMSVPHRLPYVSQHVILSLSYNSTPSSTVPCHHRVARKLENTIINIHFSRDLLFSWSMNTEIFT